jgi:hypothetical protein
VELSIYCLELSISFPETVHQITRKYDIMAGWNKESSFLLRKTLRGRKVTSNLCMCVLGKWPFHSWTFEKKKHNTATRSWTKLIAFLEQHFATIFKSFFVKDRILLKYKPHLIKIKNTCFLYRSTNTPSQTSFIAKMFWCGLTNAH